MSIAIELPNDLMNLTIVNVWNEKPVAFYFISCIKVNLSTVFFNTNTISLNIQGRNLFSKRRQMLPTP